MQHLCNSLTDIIIIIVKKYYILAMQSFCSYAEKTDNTVLAQFTKRLLLAGER